jgi:hypothetical protein
VCGPSFPLVGPSVSSQLLVRYREFFFAQDRKTESTLPSAAVAYQSAVSGKESCLHRTPESRVPRAGGRARICSVHGYTFRNCFPYQRWYGPKSVPSPRPDSAAIGRSLLHSPDCRNSEALPALGLRFHVPVQCIARPIHNQEAGARDVARNHSPTSVSAKKTDTPPAASSKVKNVEDCSFYLFRRLPASTTDRSVLSPVSWVHVTASDSSQFYQRAGATLLRRRGSSPRTRFWFRRAERLPE